MGTALRSLARLPSTVLVVLHTLLWLGPSFVGKGTPLLVLLLGLLGVFMSFGLVATVQLVRAATFRTELLERAPEIAADYPIAGPFEVLMVSDIVRAAGDTRAQADPEISRARLELKASTWTLWVGIGASFALGLIGRLIGIVAPLW
jgi:hypothetical protein